jgi:RNAse (barnase) inhibitor barstar
MRTIVLDGSCWSSRIDFYNALLSALGASDAHGSGVDALIDSMVYGGMLEAEPPYEVLVQNVAPPEVRRDVEELSRVLAEARGWRKENRGDDVEVAVRLLSD